MVNHDVKNLIGVEGSRRRQRLFLGGREVDNSWCVASAEDGCTSCVIKPSDASQRYAAKINLCASPLQQQNACGVFAGLVRISKFEAIACSRRLRWTYFLRDNKNNVLHVSNHKVEPGGVVTLEV